MDFTNKVIWVVHLFDHDYWIPQTIFNTWVIMAFLTVVCIIINQKIKHFSDKPTGLQNAVEFCVQTMDDFVISTMDQKYSYFGNWFFGIMILILCFNLSGLVGLKPPTSSLATTAAMALVTFVLIHYMGIKTAKAQYFKDYLTPFKIMLPLNIIGEFAIPISLSFRLFGNILGGYIILALYYQLIPIEPLKYGLPAFLHIYFDLFSGCLQAFIFTILSMTFIRNKIAD